MTDSLSFSQFIDDTPSLFNLVTSQNRAQKMLAYLGDLVVNGSTIKGQAGEPGLKDEIPIPTFVDPKDETKLLDTSAPCTTGWRNIIKEKGPAGFAKAVRDYPGVLIMGALALSDTLELFADARWLADTTWRGSLLTCLLERASN